MYESNRDGRYVSSMFFMSRVCSMSSTYTSTPIALDFFQYIVLLGQSKHSYLRMSKSVPGLNGKTIDQRKNEVVEEYPSPLVIEDVECKRLTRDQQHQGRRQCQPNASQKRIQSFIVLFSIPDDFKLLGNAYDLFLRLCPPKHPEFKNIATRLRSYRNGSGVHWKSRGPLSVAGLFLSGDIVLCFHCGGAHGGWSEGDDPHVEHSRWYPECFFTRFTLGDNVVNFIRREHHTYLNRLEERGRTETKGAVKALVDARFGSEDIRFYEASGIKVQVLYLAASSLREDASKDDIEAKLSELCTFRLEWRTIPRVNQCSDRTLACPGHVPDMLRPEDQPGPSQPFELAGPTGGFGYLNRSRYPKYADLSKRLATFDRFPHTPTELLNPGSMANSGLFYAGEGDNTTCFHCGGGLSHWEPFDDPAKEHMRWHPSCEYILWMLRHTSSAHLGPPDNIRPMGSCPGASVTTDHVTVMPPVLPERTADVTRPQNPGTVQRQEANGATYQTERHIIPQKEPAYRRYATLADREASFQGYPAIAKRNTQKMAKAGFFYTGTEDRTTCFQCGNSVCSWDVDDDPLVEHARWFPECPYVELQLGDLAINDVTQTHRNLIAEQHEAEMSKSDGLTEMMLHHLMSAYVVRRLLSQGIDDFLMDLAIRTRLNSTGLIDVLDEQDVRRALADVISLPKNGRTLEVPKADSGDLSKCVMCGTEGRHTIFFPCNHLVACRGCASHSTVCPSCTRPITSRRDVFLA
ncbi:death-associated inhibitor of apoptosis 1-like isoform X2 [Ornithodoros turicata]|uniref:death-associated inhibitor of apoptosis 1-like isoform X2 n=1 Tax=Ornithodoros turicata TaxID=34597 RepID=UPI0031395B2C